MEMQTSKDKELSPLDKKILNAVQKDFPLTSRPFQEIAIKVGSTETEVLSRIRQLRERGIIRRLGGVFDSQKLGFVSTLVALRVAPKQLDEVGAKISSLPGVTHNYQRDHTFNLWFTLVCPDRKELEANLAAVERYPGVEKLRNLPALQLFKIGVNFKME